MTAGSEVADTLQGILARKRDTERQAMLDALAAKEQSSQQIAREAETKRLGEATASSIAAQNEQMFQSKLGNVRRGTTAPNIADEDLRKTMMERGLMETKGIQGPTLSGEGDLGSISSYRGTAKEETDDTQKMMMQELAARYPDMQGLDVLAAGGPAIPSMLTRRVNPTIYDPDTDKITTVQGVQVPENDAFHIEPSSPIGRSGSGASTKPTNYRVIDEATGKDIGGVPLSPDQMAAWYEANPGRSIRPAGFKAQVDPQIAATLRNKVTDIRGPLTQAMENDTKSADGWLWNSDPKDSPLTSGLRAQHDSAVGQLLAATSAAGASKEEYDTTVGQLLMSDTTIPQNVKEVATTILGEPDLAGLPLSQILQEIELTDPETGAPLQLGPRDMDILGRTLSIYGKKFEAPVTGTPQ